jgi:uncharacterized RDD family membrane protein YckC
VADVPGVGEGYGERPSWGRRFVGYLIDAVASDLVALLFTRPPSGAYTGAVLGIFVAERIIFTALTGASLGQRLAGYAVVRLDNRPIGLLGAVIRTFLLALFVPVLLTGRDGRGLHDRAAGTVLVRR